MEILKLGEIYKEAELLHGILLGCAESENYEINVYVTSLFPDNYVISISQYRINEEMKDIYFEGNQRPILFPNYLVIKTNDIKNLISKIAPDAKVRWRK